MKTIILCGGKGTRLSEETVSIPKPMIKIGNHPILWHIMSRYALYNYKNFVLALGYKGTYIKDYFHRFFSINSDFTIDLASGNIDYHKNPNIDWKVTLVNTGEESMTGGRLYCLRDYLKNESLFMVTYGDGVSNIDIESLVKFHKSHGKLATVTSVRPPARFGEMLIDEKCKVSCFKEKPQTETGWINGGFFVFDKKILNYIAGEMSVLEKEPLENIAKDGQLMAYTHDGFWQCMDTLRDKEYLNNLAETNNQIWLKK